MNKLFIGLAAFFMLAIGMQAETVVSCINESSSGTTSCTVYVRPGTTSFVKLTDVAWKVDSANVSSTLNIRTGRKRFAVTSATASGTTIWFDNSNSVVAASDYFMLHDVSTDTLYLYKASAAATASVTSYTSLSAATTTSDYVWTLNGVVTRPATDVATSGTALLGTIYLPGKEPAAITLDGNTTSCRLSVSGVRANN